MDDAFIFIFGCFVMALVIFAVLLVARMEKKMLDGDLEPKSSVLDR